MLSITLRKRWCIMKLFHPVVQGRRANTCRHSRQILTCRLFDSCQKEGNFGSSQHLIYAGTHFIFRCDGICRHSFPCQMRFSRNRRIMPECLFNPISNSDCGCRPWPADGTTISFRCSLAPKYNLCQARWASQWAAGPGASGPSLARPGPSVPAGGRVPGPAARS